MPVRRDDRRLHHPRPRRYGRRRPTCCGAPPVPRREERAVSRHDGTAQRSPWKGL